MEFSPDSKKIYFTYQLTPGNDTICQYNMNIYDSAMIKQSEYAMLSTSRAIGHMQLGANGKIYIANPSPSTIADTLSVINNPNGSGALCNFQDLSLPLPNLCSYSLPIYPNYYFNNIAILSSIDEYHDNGEFKIYPNPCKEYTNLFFKQYAKNNISIYDVEGKLLFKIETNDLSLKINTQDFESGIYFLKVQNNTGVTTQKLIVNQ
jgi:hypothetical protein